MQNNRPVRLLVSTRNAHKTSEIRSILGGQFHVCDLSEVPDFGPVEESGSTFEENATLKAVAGSMVFDGWVIADDSGLEVDALGGDPGVFSARYSGASAQDSDNNALLLKNLNGIPANNRTARFQCVIVLARAGRKMAAFCGSVEGVIAETPAGDHGFGYDPLFIPLGYSSSFAELSGDIKNGMSHRSKALQKLAAWGGWC